MGCVSSSYFVVLVNGSPSYFFPAFKGLHQGCPLSPLLFILIMESLNCIILDAQHKGHIKGFQYSPHLSITHLLFVDDVILIGVGTVEEWSAYKDALDLFCSASGMTVSIEKSSFLYQNVDVDIRNKIAEFLPFRMEPLTVGFKYLGYHLKPLGYHTSDWRWMIDLFERKT